MTRRIRAYLLTTGSVFGLVTIAHLWRAIAESRALARDPWFVVITIFAAGQCVWAVSLLRQGPARP